MGNDVSSTTARTAIPLDDSACWQLYNGINERSEAISIFISKQTFSVECRRSIQFLKTIRHPNIVKFLTGFKTFVDQDSFIADCVHPLANKLNTNDIDSTAKLSLGLYQLSQGLEFLHGKASISHNNLCLLSLYVSLNGTWKLGNFECACRYNNLNKKYLASLKLIRGEECVTPEENETNPTEINSDQIYAIDVYAFGTLIRHLLTIVNVHDSLKSLLNDLQTILTDDEPQTRPTWTNLLKTELFQIDYIRATELLDRLPTVNESDLPNAIDSLSTCLDGLDGEYFNELFIRRLFAPFMFLCSSTRSKLIPRLLTPKTESNDSYISTEKYRAYVIPLLTDLFAYHVTCIRVSLLEYFQSYWQLIDKTTLVNTILPQLVYGLKDSNNTICVLTLNALSLLVPVLGADVIIGGQRRQIFTDNLRKESVAFPKSAKHGSTTNSPLPTPIPTPPPPQKPRKTSPVTTNKTKPLRLKPSPSPEKTTSNRNEQLSSSSVAFSQYTNGHHSLSDKSVEEPAKTVTQNGLSDHQIDDTIEIDNDDGQWSDWEHQTDPPVASIDYSQLIVPPLPPPPPEEKIQPKGTTTSLESLKLTRSSKIKWDPNAPLGSEYEIPPVTSAKKKNVKVETSVNRDTDDFFKDMMPKVETVDLMQQLETMFNVSTHPPKEQTKSTIIKSSSSSFSKKFGVASQNHEDNQEKESGNNNWDD